MTRLLVVDDNEQNLYMLQVLLRGHGYEVASAGDGAEALEQARCDPPDVIITDILMPVMDGFALCREWKKDEQLKEIPLVFYTATYTDPQDKELALNLGAERFLVKPVEPDVLVRMLREIIEKAEAGRLVAPREPVEEEAVYFKEYNEALIRKLEDKMLQLEATNQELACEIAERVRAEEALRESEGRFHELFQGTPACCWTYDRKGVILDWNRACEELYGWTAEQAIGKSMYELMVQEENVSATQENMAAIFQGQSFQGLEFEDLRADGTVCRVLTNEYPIKDASGQVIMGIFAELDITERVRAEEERELLLAQIRGQAKQMQQIIDTVPEGVLLLDAKGLVILANPAAERDLAALAGVKVGDALTRLGERPLAELLTSPPTQGLWHEVKAEGRTFEVIARPMGKGPEPEDWVLVINDVTRAREIQEQLQQQVWLAALGQLAAGIAHDFNNILAVIVLYSQLMARSERLPDGTREGLAIINQQARHATRLIQQILDFGRRAMLEQQPLDLSLLLTEQVELLKRTLPEHIEIVLAYSREEEYAVSADPSRMQQVIMNLAVNARDAMPEGGSLRMGLERVEIEPGKSPLLPEMEAGEWIRLTVSDTGMGIAPDALLHIFEPFFTTKAPGEGSGLGLAQVYGIVGQHGGRIDVETQVGEGTTFIIYLPALAVYPVEPPTPDDSTMPEGQGELVLVVEDETALRTALVQSLEYLNYQALEAANGEQALAVMEKHGKQVALVLSDMVMPVMGGIALLHALRQKGWEMPVILLTGHAMGKDFEELRAQGLTAWLLKPLSVERLAQELASALSE